MFRCLYVWIWRRLSDAWKADSLAEFVDYVQFRDNHLAMRDAFEGIVLGIIKGQQIPVWCSRAVELLVFVDIHATAWIKLLTFLNQ